MGEKKPNFEKLTDKKAIWTNKETKNYQKWKQKIHKEFGEKTNGNPYYGGKITKPYEEFLIKLLKSSSEKV